MRTHRSVLVAHPSADVYGSDLQLLESVSAIVERGGQVRTVVPEDGPLVERLRERGATVDVVSFPVLRKSLLSPVGLLGLLLSLLRAFPRLLRACDPSQVDVVLVNTVTIPWWLLAARLRGVRTVCHVHEAEDEGNAVVLAALAAPNLLAGSIVVNSNASAAALTRRAGLLRRRIVVVHNGVPGPDTRPEPPRARRPGDPARLVVVARVSPRKGVDVALDATALLRQRGHDVTLDVCGSVFPGYEWFERELRARAAQTPLEGAVTLHGYVSPTWPVLAAADVVLVPSRVEPFGNTAVEALRARRPLVASGVQGLMEIVEDGETGLLAEPGDAEDLADAVERFLADPTWAAEVAEAGEAEARARFSVAAYRERIAAALGVTSPATISC